MNKLVIHVHEQEKKVEFGREKALFAETCGKKYMNYECTKDAESESVGIGNFAGIEIAEFFPFFLFSC